MAHPVVIERRVGLVDRFAQLIHKSRFDRERSHRYHSVQELSETGADISRLLPRPTATHKIGDFKVASSRRRLRPTRRYRIEYCQYMYAIMKAGIKNQGTMKATTATAPIRLAM